MSRRPPTPMCPIRLGEPCSLCAPGATGRQDCGLVYLVQSDPELRDQLAARRSTHSAQVRAVREVGGLSAPAAAAR
ncbi:DUF6767 domain-containing protein [Terrabacter sp. 2RAF25]|uniref:DUF6767 domain-containing protein n=1 Tax=Terrabacter sp. 2RAF25 TaxID=3232998 RepID=UPI003F970D6A